MNNFPPFSEGVDFAHFPIFWLDAREKIVRIKSSFFESDFSQICFLFMQPRHSMIIQLLPLRLRVDKDEVFVVRSWDKLGLKNLSSFAWPLFDLNFCNPPFQCLKNCLKHVFKRLPGSQSGLASLSFLLSSFLWLDLLLLPGTPPRVSEGERGGEVNELSQLRKTLSTAVRGRFLHKHPYHQCLPNDSASVHFLAGTLIRLIVWQPCSTTQLFNCPKSKCGFCKQQLRSIKSNKVWTYIVEKWKRQQSRREEEKNWKEWEPKKTGVIMQREAGVSLLHATWWGAIFFVPMH